jgi:hypothetical protein
MKKREKISGGITLMVEVNKDIAAQSLKWLEVLIDEGDLSDAEKGEIQTLINFWRMYVSFASVE